jgi:hypothetical protein
MATTLGKKPSRSNSSDPARPTPSRDHIRNGGRFLRLKAHRRVAAAVRWTWHAQTLNRQTRP